MLENLQEIRVEGKRALLTNQLAECYGTEPQIITNNFNRNRERYISGKHYYALEGTEKIKFSNLNQFDLGSLKNAKRIYLWTERGALLHAKSLNTDKAWDVYEWLVDFYFRAREIQQQNSQGKFFYKNEPIIPEEDFLAIAKPNKKQSKLLFRETFFKAGLDWNGLGWDLKAEFEAKYKCHYEGETLIYLKYSGVQIALGLFQANIEIRKEIASYFPEKQRRLLLT